MKVTHTSKRHNNVDDEAGVWFVPETDITCGVLYFRDVRGKVTAMYMHHTDEYPFLGEESEVPPEALPVATIHIETE